MSKIGRNDPCPCGSGKKYKKCHLVEAELAETPAPESLKLIPGLFPGPSDDEAFVNPFQFVPMKLDMETKLDELLHEVEFRDMIRLAAGFMFEAQIEKAPWIKGFFERLEIAATSLEERNAYRDLLIRLLRENPKVFAEIGGEILWEFFEAMVADRRADQIETLFIGYAAFATGGLLLFFSLADGLAYFGFLDILVRGMRAGWPAVRVSKMISPESIDRYTHLGINYEVFSALDGAATVNEAELSRRIRYFQKWEAWEVKKCIEVMTAGFEKKVMLADYSAEPVELQKHSDSWVTFHTGLNDLIHAFRGYLRRKKNLAWTRADLAAGEISDTINAWIEDPVQDERKDMDATAYWQDLPCRNLIPDPESLEHYFGHRLYDDDKQEYRVVALLTNLASWLEFLMELEWLTPAVTMKIRTDWESALEDFNLRFEDVVALGAAAL